MANQSQGTGTRRRTPRPVASKAHDAHMVISTDSHSGAIGAGSGMVSIEATRARRVCASYPFLSPESWMAHVMERGCSGDWVCSGGYGSSGTCIGASDINANQSDTYGCSRQ